MDVHSNIFPILKQILLTQYKQFIFFFNILFCRHSQSIVTILPQGDT